MLNIGDWVKQFRSGYWKIIDIKPKFAEEDYTFENGIFQKKGELIGYWVLLKKGFTPKMKFRIESDICDSAWCKRVSREEALLIEHFFNENPDKLIKFNETPYVDSPAVCTMWVNIADDEEEKKFMIAMERLPKLFTEKQIMNLFYNQGLSQCFSKPPASHRFVCQHTLWELDDEYNTLYKNPMLCRTDDKKMGVTRDGSN